MATALPSPPPLNLLLERDLVALFCDFDGTLVEIAPTPDDIVVPPGLVGKLHALADRIGGRMGIVSGRGIEDLEGHTGPLVLYRAGSHGASRLRPDGSRIGEVPEGLPESCIGELKVFSEANGLDYECKPHGGALHFRADFSLGELALAKAQALAQTHGLAVKRGKGVVELVRPGANKGAATHALLGESAFAGSLPVFIGDDLTDEDGFAAARDHGGFGIVVGDRPSTNARYRLETVEAVRRWLEL
ncbi:MAG: trehalose-phosphatase [Qipengyuania sp.]